MYVHGLTQPALRCAGVVLLAAATACDNGGPSQLGPSVVLTAEGRLERGSTVTFGATLEGAVIPPAEVALTFIPANAAEVTGPGQVRLLRDGSVEVRATSRGRTGTTRLTVAMPPIVVFDMMVSGNRDLYKIALDGGDFTRLTEHSGDDRDPTAAAGRIVFTSYRAGNAELYAVPLAGGTETRLTTTPGGESSPALSRDGQRLAYSYDGTGIAKLWTASGTATGAAPAAPSFGYDGSVDSSPTWAPDGNRLAFMSTASGSADIWQLSLGGQPTLLSGTSAPDVDPAWSSDGQYVSFVSTRDGTPELYLFTVATGQVSRLTTRAGTEGDAAWTSDGRLVFLEFAGNEVTALRWMDPTQPGTVNAIAVPGNPRRLAVAR